MQTKASEVHPRERRLFESLSIGNDGVTVKRLWDVLTSKGIARRDIRIKHLRQALATLKDNDTLDIETFCRAIRPNIGIVERAIRGDLVIPEFEVFTAQIDAMFAEATADRSGEVATYIPQLGRVDPEQFGVALCTVDGQRYGVGEIDVDFCVQSTCKPILYSIALEESGEDVVHSHVGREPSGRGFNELTLNPDGRPHNPMINAGAIMSCSLIKPELPQADRFDFVMDRWHALCGNEKVGFNNAVYLSERETADRNFALGYFMQENRAFPDNTDMLQTLEFYFQCCSLELNAEKMSVIAATLANGGVCPTTGERIFSPRTVQNCLSLMSSCGMYDFSGEFAFAIGLPAKSGVSGALLIVVPNVMGVCTWSPRLDRLGNSVRGINFCASLVRKFNFHHYDSLTGLSEKDDPRRTQVERTSDEIATMIWAASRGDLTQVIALHSRGVSVNSADYDGRTPLHLAAAGGHVSLVEFFIGQGANLNAKDRWGGTALHDAAQSGHQSVVTLLETNGAHKSIVATS